MTSWYIFKQQTPIFVEQLYNYKKNAEESRFKEHIAAVKIQSWYKGIRLRSYIKSLKTYAIVIQRHWRGFTGREKFRIYLKNACDNMCVKKYNESAKIIQKHWKGFYVRKFTFDYYKYKKYLRDLEVKNNYTIEFINEFQQNREKEEQINCEVNDFKEMKSWALKNHYLISTKVQPGIYNSPFNRSHFPKEYLLKESQKSRPIKIVKNLSKEKANPGFLYDPACTLITEKPLPLNHLPPLNPFAPQGPFKKPEEVRKQRYRGLNPSLRVMTDFESLEKARIVMKNEEWTKRLHDNVFLPVINRPPPYEPMLLTSTEYSKISYGNTHFREESKLNVDQIPFKTIVPPIQAFDKLNKQYVENYSI